MILCVFLGVLCGFAVQIRAADFQVNGKTFHLPDGFTLEVAAAPPVVERPIIADFDEQGRLYVADSSGSSSKGPQQLEEKSHRILRLEPANVEGKFEKQTVFADRMMFPEGCMWHGGSVYVGAPPSIWQLTDVNGDGVADQRFEWHNGRTLTGCANDVHGPYMGPDGWIYWTKGAFAEQSYTLPTGKPFTTHAAHIFRARPDGSGIEPVMIGGMDNPVEVVFTRGGERIFTTTFLVNPANGQRDGIIHAVYGGIYGKVHDVTDPFPHTSPELMPVLVHTGPAAECGLLRYDSEVFGKEYRDNLFATSFNLHKVTRHVLTPDGATFASKNEDFLTCDSFEFHPTHLLEDADGSLLVVDTGGWYKICCPTSQLGRPDVRGAIYRIRKSGAPKIDDPRGLKLAWGKLSVDDLTRLLADPRPAVRRRAVEALGDVGGGAIAAMTNTIAHSDSAEARTNAVWAACHVTDTRARSIARAAMKDSDDIVRQAAIHSASVWRDKDALGQLVEVLAGGSAQNKRAAAEAIGRMGDPRPVAALYAALAQPVDRVLEHSLIYAVIEIGDPSAAAEGLNHPQPSVRRAAMVALDQMGAKELTAAMVVPQLTSPDERMRETAAWIASRHAEWSEQVTGQMAELMKQPNLSDAQVAPLRQELAAMSKGEAIQKLLADVAADAKAPESQRRLALAAMRDAAPREIPAPWIGAISAALASNEAAVVTEAVATARAMRFPKEAAEGVRKQLVAVGANGNLPADVRIRAMASAPGGVGQVDQATFEFVISQLSPERPLDQRIAAAEILGAAKLSLDQQRALVAAIKTAGPMELDRMLGAFDKSTDNAIGEVLVAALKEARSLKTVRPDAVRKHVAKFGPQVKQQLEAILANLGPDAAKQKARIDELMTVIPSGDAHRGQAVFNQARTSCVACHAIGYVGGHVGPDLTHVGSVRTERDLLESVVFPSASFVQTFEPMTVITDTGERHDGILKRNDADEVWLVEGPDKELHLPRKNVKELRPGTLSIMPEGFDGILNKQELADLVAFLKANK